MSISRTWSSLVWLPIVVAACSGSDADNSLLGSTAKAGSAGGVVTGGAAGSTSVGGAGGAVAGGSSGATSGGSAGADPAGGSAGAPTAGSGGADPVGGSGGATSGGSAGAPSGGSAGKASAGSAGKASGGSAGKASGGSGGATCVGGEQPATPAPLDLVILMDRSGSMADAEKWPTVTSAVGELVASLDASARVSLRYMGAPPSKPPPTSCMNDAQCGEYGPCLSVFNMCSGGVGGAAADSCDPADYAVAIVPLTPAPQAAALVTQSLAAHKPDGGASPVFAALFGTLQNAVETQKLRPEATTRVLFATDGGEPTGCTKNMPSDVAAVAKAGWETGRVRTYIAGVAGAGELPSPLEPVAAAGGSEKAFVLPTGSSVAAVSQAMRAVVPRCTFSVPAASSYSLVRRSAGGDLALPPVGVLAACSGEGYWLDDPQAPKKIELCPTSCKALVGPNDSIVVKAPCP